MMSTLSITDIKRKRNMFQVTSMRRIQKRNRKQKMMSEMCYERVKS